jgi:putative SOS response-associated peptidase YedK
MCGRFRLARSKEILEAAFDIPAFDIDDSSDADNASVASSAFATGSSMDAAQYQPRYNISPGQPILAVLHDSAHSATHSGTHFAEAPARQLRWMHWGLIPYWAKDPAIGYKMINARAETVASKPSFSEPMRQRRCLIPADGFYEWKRDGKLKLPWSFTLADNSLFALAGLWEHWQSPQGAVIESCTILTTAPNQLMHGIHDRMPVILPPTAYGRWLDPALTNIEQLQPLLQPYPAEAMRRYRVSPRVNHAKNDDPECAAEIEAAQLLPLDAGLFAS